MSDTTATPPDRAEAPAHDRVEVVAAVLLGLAAVAIAWATFQAALWGGQQDEAYTESVRAANEAVDLLQSADTTRSLDQSLYVEVLTSGVCDGADTRACDEVLVALSDPGRGAVEEWLAGDRSTNPFESPAYTDALYATGLEAKAESQRFFEDGGEANQNGDDYELAVTILTVVLFFAGIAVVLKDRTASWVLLGVAAVLLVGGGAYVVILPLA